MDHSYREPRSRRVISINDYELPPRQTRSRSRAAPQVSPLPDDDVVPYDPMLQHVDGRAPTVSPYPSVSPLSASKTPELDESPHTTEATIDIQSTPQTYPQSAPSHTPQLAPSSNAQHSSTSQSTPASLPDDTKSAVAASTTQQLHSPLLFTSSPPYTPSYTPSSLTSDEAIRESQDAFRRVVEPYVRAQESKDYLLRLPPDGYQYVKDGQINFTPSRFDYRRRKDDSFPEQPKTIEAREQATLTAEMWKCAVAGIPLDKAYTPRYTREYNSAREESPDTDNSTQEDAFHTRPSIKLIIPDILKAMLVDDWENVTKNNQLVPLPHPHPVTKILEDYSAYETPKRPEGSSHVDILEETLAGLKEYFDKSLGRILLYRFERAQYADMHKKWMSDDPEYQGKTASDTYGAEHLMRLLVSLPELVAQTNMDQQSVNRLREELSKLCTWLSRNTAEYFVSQYESPTQEYIQKAKE